ncbi:inosine triphosphate pyrophosphatase isoform X2 [Brevipalpus obovatus]
MAKKMDLVECQGNEEFIIKNKCKEAFRIVNAPVIVEDTSLSFTAFKGLPGPYIKYFLDNLGPQGLYRMLKDWNDKSAIASCRIAFCPALDSEPSVFIGEISGHIVPARGDSGFGFDHCFQPLGYEKTLSEMGQEEKNSISHRFLAAKAMRDYFKLVGDQFTS